MTDYGAAMRAPERALAVAGTLTLASGREIALTGADVLSLTVDEGVDDGMLLGAVLSAKHSLRLASAGGEWLPGGAKLGSDDFRGATVRLSIGAGGQLAPLCTFVVREAEAEARGGAVALAGYDSMYEETAAAFFDTLHYPATLLQVVRHILGHTRYPLPADLPNGGAVVYARPGWGAVSVRAALGYALALAGCFARVSRAGALEILPVHRPAAEVDDIGAASVLKRTHGFSDFGPLNALTAASVRGEGGDGEPEDLEAVYDALLPLSSTNTLDLGGNPLLVAGTSGLRTLLNGALSAVRGLTLCRASFRFRGDPELTVGDSVAVDGTASILTRQKLLLARGFAAECELGAPDTSENALRAITPEGGLNAARLTGVVDGGLLAVESVTAASIRAGSVTAEKLSAGAVRAQALEAVTARVGELVAGQVEADALYAGIADIASAEIGRATIDGARIGDASIVAAKIQDAAITAAKIKNGAIGTAKIALGAITTALIQNGAIGAAQIADASITSGKIVSLNADAITAGTLSVERLLLKGADGLFVAINATDAGLTTEQLSEEEYQKRISGTVLVAKSVTAAQIAAETITANELAAGTITADKVDVADLMASEAAVGVLETYDIRNSDAITLTVGGERKTFLRVREGGVEIGEDGGDYKAVVAGDRLDIRQSGQAIASFAYNRMWTQAAEVQDYLTVGGYTLRRTADGGVAFAM